MFEGKVKVLFNSEVISITPQHVNIRQKEVEQLHLLENDLVYIFAGGELPTQFLEQAGIKISKRFGYTMMKHR